MTTPRRPLFLTALDGGREVHVAAFDAGPSPHLDPLTHQPPPAPKSVVMVPEPPAPVPPSPPPNTPPAELVARYEAAIETLRLQSQRLSEQARADAIEIAFQVAQKLIETELMTNPEPLFALIRSAVQKLGETRRVVIRICPADLNMMKSERGQREQTALCVAQIELVADPTLQRGDCIVESSLGAADGRLATRLAEMRNAVASIAPGAAA